MSADIPMTWAALPVAPDPGAILLGEHLMDAGAVGEDALGQALAVQAETRRPLGEILIARGETTPTAVSAALAAQWGLGHANLVAEPPDAGAIDRSHLDLYLRHRIIPWRRVGDLTCYATAEPQQTDRVLADLGANVGTAVFAVAPQGDIDRAILGLLPATLAMRAASRTSDEMSVRTLDTPRQIAVAALLLVPLCLWFNLPVTMALLAAMLFTLNCVTMVTRLVALGVSFREDDQAVAPDEEDGTISFSARRPPPKISLLIPLYEEAGMIPRIVAALEKVDYARELLDVKLLLEQSDTATRAAVEGASLPPWITALVLPDGAPRTKPRALNLALDFCNGEIVGILDAEDRPDPDQLRNVAAHLRNAPTEVACVQCQLAWYNARETWVTRCFQIEYAIWFDVLLRGWQRLGMPVPLGGTSVYFRKSALEALGGWDAHNVTEDADLGMRIARHGMRCAVLSSTTEEEANRHAWPWIRQRSRWLKGYMLTWLNHMRKPIQLWRDLGPRGFLGFNVLFIGAAASYLAMPLFWIALVLTLTTGATIYGDAIPPWAVGVLGFTLLAGQLVMLGCAVLALRRRGELGLIWWALALPVYWTLGAAAAWKAVFEIATAPFYWDKTQHGNSRFT